MPKKTEATSRSTAAIIKKLRIIKEEANNARYCNFVLILNAADEIIETLKNEKAQEQFTCVLSDGTDFMKETFGEMRRKYEEFMKNEKA